MSLRQAHGLACNFPHLPFAVGHTDNLAIRKLMPGPCRDAFQTLLGENLGRAVPQQGGPTRPLCDSRTVSWRLDGLGRVLIARPQASEYHESMLSMRNVNLSKSVSREQYYQLQAVNENAAFCCT